MATRKIPQGPTADPAAAKASAHPAEPAEELVFAIALFGGGSAATRTRRALLERVAREIDGFEFVRYQSGRPGMFLVSWGGQLLGLRLSQVEAFVAGLRVGHAVKGRKSRPSARAIAGHYLPEQTPTG